MNLKTQFDVFIKGENIDLVETAPIQVTAIISDINPMLSINKSFLDNSFPFKIENIALEYRMSAKVIRVAPIIISEFIVSFFL